MHRNLPTIQQGKGIVGFLFESYRNKTYYILISYLFVGLNFFFFSQAYGLEASSSNYTASLIEFLHGGGLVSSTNVEEREDAKDD